MRFHIRSLDNMRFHIRSLDNMRFHIRSLDNSSLSGQLSIDLADSMSQTKEKESSLTTASEATLQRVPQIQLCRDSFQQLALQEQLTTSSFQETACSSSLSTKALDSNNFQDSSLTEETFSKTTSKTAAWEQRPSARQLQRQQLDEENFAESSLNGTLPSQLGRQQLERHFAFAASQTAAWQLSFEQPSFQTRTSTTELAQFERRVLTTELSQLERTALTTELAQLQLRKLQRSNCEESTLREESLFGGIWLRTARCQGGVLRSLLLSPSFLDHLDLAMTFMAQACPGESLQLVSLAKPL